MIIDPERMTQWEQKTHDWMGETIKLGQEVTQLRREKAELVAKIRQMYDDMIADQVPNESESLSILEAFMIDAGIWEKKT